MSLKETKAIRTLEQTHVNLKEYTILIPRTSPFFLRSHHVVIMLNDKILIEEYINDIMAYDLGLILKRDDVIDLAVNEITNNGEIKIRLIIDDLADSTYVFPADPKLFE